MKYGIIIAPAAPVRKAPNHRREMVNQLLFGEAVKVLKRKGDTWLKVESLFDGYTGWITNHFVAFVGKQQAILPITHLAGALLNKVIINELPMHIPMGAALVDFKSKAGTIGDVSYQYAGKVIKTSIKDADKSKTIEKYARQWLNAPYMWGGKTVMGVDCSGFSQTIFKLAGISLPRDAWQQAKRGKTVKKLIDARIGDLAFFDDQDEIVHVGILLGPDEIIHAAGKVRIDRIDRKGIIRAETGKRTHQLKIIKRFHPL